MGNLPFTAAKSAGSPSQLHVCIWGLDNYWMRGVFTLGNLHMNVNMSSLANEGVENLPCPVCLFMVDMVNVDSFERDGGRHCPGGASYVYEEKDALASPKTVMGKRFIPDFSTDCGRR